MSQNSLTSKRGGDRRLNQTGILGPSNKKPFEGSLIDQSQVNGSVKEKFKIVVVGDPKTGKSSLIENQRDTRFNGNLDTQCVDPVRKEKHLQVTSRSSEPEAKVAT